MSTWINYAEQRPKAAGAYRWRLPSLAVPGLFVIFTAHMRERGAGHERVLSPMFDYWDGYRILLPEGVQWQELDSPSTCARHEVKDVAIEGLEIRECPYCLKAPKLDGVLRYNGGGVGLSEPNKFNSWQLKCCTWGQTPTYADPRELVASRERVLDFIAPGEPVDALVLADCADIRTLKYGQGYFGTDVVTLYRRAAPSALEEAVATIARLRGDYEYAHNSGEIARAERDALNEALTQANADKAAYGQNAIDMQRRVQNADLALKAQTQNCEGLRTQLVERDALLQSLKNRPVHEWASGKIESEIDAALSASAETSAPIEIDERAELEAYCAKVVTARPASIGRVPDPGYTVRLARLACPRPRRPEVQAEPRG